MTQIPTITCESCGTAFVALNARPCWACIEEQMEQEEAA